MKIVIVGLGYVGLSNAVLLAQHNEVIGVDTNSMRVDAINARKSPIVDDELSRFLKDKQLDLRASTNLIESLSGADYVIVSTPTNYNEQTNSFDTNSVEAVTTQVISNKPDTCVIVKSTIPIGFVDKLRKRLKTDRIIFSPEFLREGKALHDNLYPSRIIIGEKSQRAKVFADLLAEGAKKQHIECVFTGTREAEAIKLFANTYLAMRVAFFNELDSYALAENLSAEEIIKGISLDPRVGQHYNNPSFGYGGYCLPKDTRQLLANYDSVPQNIISAIVDSNSTRKSFLVNEIVKKTPKTVGIYRLIMKAGSDNFRQSAILEIARKLIEKNIDVVVYEPNLSEAQFSGFRVETNLEDFKNYTDLILANRNNIELKDVMSKIFTRDIFNEN